MILCAETRAILFCSTSDQMSKYNILKRPEMGHADQSVKSQATHALSNDVRGKK